MEKILVVGANGTVGKELVRLLRLEGKQVFETTHRAASGSHQRHVDLVTKEGVEEALIGIDRVFLLSPPGHANQFALLDPVIQAARQQKVKRLVLMTAMGVNFSDEIPLRKAELALEASGIPHTILRPNWFMQNFNSYWIGGILAQGKVLLNAGQAKVTFIDARDIAAVAAKTLLTDGPNQVFDLTGSESLDHAQAAKILSDVTGKSIVYESITAEAMLKGLTGAGLPVDYSQVLVAMLSGLSAGHASHDTGAVKKILGRDPITFRKYAEDYRQSWL